MDPSEAAHVAHEQHLSALFPAAIAVLSLVGLVGQGPSTVASLLDILRDLGATSAADTIEPTLVELSQARNSGITLVVGLAVALWSASVP